MKKHTFIGRRDIVDLPDFQISNIGAKVDTGAYGNALHCHQIRVHETKGKTILQFRVLDPSHPGYREQVYTSENFKEKEIKNS